MIQWHAEACDLRPDPVSGAPLARLTAAVMSNINIYFEQAFGTPDGSRFAYLRAPSPDPRLAPTELCVCDINRYRTASIDDTVAGMWVATSPWSGKVVYLRRNGELILVDLMTLEKQIALTHWPLPANCGIWSLTPDLRYLICSFQDSQFMCNLARVDLRTRQWKVIYRHPDIHNHIQVEPGKGERILLQRNRGRRRNDLWEDRTEQRDDPGSTHVVIDLDGGNEKPVPIGEPWCAATTGHATWLGTSGRIASPVAHAPGCIEGCGRGEKPVHDPRHPQGNYAVARPGDDAPVILSTPAHVFVHAAGSPCGEYFVADDFSHGVPGNIQITVGSTRTGRTRVLVQDCGAQGGGPACSHPHPYFTADMKRVIFNADPHQVCHVHMAGIPAGFLDGLNA